MRGLLILAAATGLSATSSAQGDDAVPPVARRALAAPGVQWTKRQTRNADLYFLAGSPTERMIGSTVRDAERAIADNLSWLGVNTAPRLRLFFVGSRAQMKPFTGGTSGGWSVTEEGTAFFVVNDSVRPALRHETMHLLSWRLWGAPGGQWLSEGLATAAVGVCRGQSPEQVVAAIRGAGLFVPLDVLRRSFVVEGEVGVVHYYEAATLVRYIERTYGRKRFHDFWSGGGLGHIRETLGVDEETLEHGWRESLSRTTPKSSWSRLWPQIRAHGCE